MFRLIFTIFFLLFSLIFGENGYIIKEYNIDITINKNNIYDVTEEIKVEFLENKHGIFRTIPTYYKNRKTEISNIKSSSEALLKKEEKLLTLKLGNPKSFVIGKKNYLISFSQNLGWDEIRDYDEVYYNVIGNYWDTTIEKVNFNITLPRAFDSNKINFTSGLKNKKTNNHVTWTIKNNTISGYTLQGLKPHESITLALPLREGYFDVYVPPEKTSREKFLEFLKKFPKISIIYLLLIFIYSILFKKSKKDNRQNLNTEFYPPEDLTPAELGYVINGKISSSHMTSMIYYWANKGYLEIENHDSNNIIIKKLEDIKEGKEFEVYLFNQLFSFSLDSSTVDIKSLKNRFYPSIREASRLLISQIDRGERAIFVNSKTFKILTKITNFIPLLGFANVVISKTSSPLFVLVSVGGGVLTSIILQKLSRKNKKRTDYGYLLLGRCLGFKKFLEEESINSDFKTSNYFYENLAYVIVLNLNSAWAHKFKDLVTEPPRWYRHNYPRHYNGYFNSMYFMSHLNDSSYFLNRTMYSSPVQRRSNSSSEGGSSGGGAGGGGGGSW